MGELNSCHGGADLGIGCKILMKTLSHKVFNVVLLYINSGASGCSPGVFRFLAAVKYLLLCVFCLCSLDTE